jgi:biopolymer transport protein ExbB/biopolymer transport protein TolQ
MAPLGDACAASGAVGVLILQVSDSGDRPIRAVILSAKGGGSTSNPTDIAGKTQVLLPPGTQPGGDVFLTLVRAPSKDLRMIAPWHGHGIVPAWGGFLEVVLAAPGDLKALASPIVLKSVTAAINYMNGSRGGDGGLLAQTNLREVSQELDLEPALVNGAIRAWATKVSDPQQMRLAIEYLAVYPPQPGIGTLELASLPVRPSAKVAFHLLCMWTTLGWPAKLVAICLFIMAAWSIGVMIDRWILYEGARTQSRLFAPGVAGALREGNIEAALEIAEKNKRSPLAKVVAAGLLGFQSHSLWADAPGECLETSKWALDHATMVAHKELERGLSGLAITSLTAPLVGLLGVALSIIQAGADIPFAGSAEIYEFAAFVIPALVPFAFGLIVSISSAMMYRYFTSRVEGFDVEMANASSELIDYFANRLRRKY